MKVSSGGVAIQFTLDSLTRSRLTYIKLVAPKLLDVNASGSAIVRRALSLYVQHLDDLQNAQGAASQGLDRVSQEDIQSFESNALKRAHAGDYPPWTDFPTEALNATPRPTFDELVRQHHRKALESLGKHPVGRPSGATTAARERILNTLTKDNTDDVSSGSN